MGYIYKITNLLNNKIYIGKTSRTIEERFQEHLKLSVRSTHYLHRSIKKHGVDSFRIELLEEISDVLLLNEREIFWIDQLNSLAPNGYNCTKGGNGGDMSLSINFQNSVKNRDTKGEKNHMFGKLGKNNPNFGSTRTDEQKKEYKERIKTSLGCKC